MSRIDTKDIAALMKRCQIGCGGRDALEQAHEIMADCYGTLGALSSERDALRAQVAQLRESLARVTKATRRHWPNCARPSYSACACSICLADAALAATEPAEATDGDS